jgi:hypothetical protein
MELDFQKLQQGSYVPRIHPNGFIQLDIAPGFRLHVWTEEKLAQPSVTVSMHDHTFGFDSFVLLGQIGNCIYDIEPSEQGAFHLYQVMPYIVAEKETPFLLTDGKYNLKKIQEFWTIAGKSYHMNPFVFHETKTKGLAVTVIKVGEFDKTKSARVLCPIDKKPDNFFKRDTVSQEVLWGYIERALTQAQYRKLPDNWITI